MFKIIQNKVARLEHSPYLKVSKLNNMNLELTNDQKTALHAAILTRVRHIEKMIYDWETYPDEHSDFLIKSYSRESKTLCELEEILFLK